MKFHRGRVRWRWARSEAKRSGLTKRQAGVLFAAVCEDIDRYKKCLELFKSGTSYEDIRASIDVARRLNPPVVIDGSKMTAGSLIAYYGGRG